MLVNRGWVDRKHADQVPDETSSQHDAVTHHPEKVSAQYHSSLTRAVDHPTYTPLIHSPHIFLPSFHRRLHSSAATIPRRPARTSHSTPHTSHNVCNYPPTHHCSLTSSHRHPHRCCTAAPSTRTFNSPPLHSYTPSMPSRGSALQQPVWPARTFALDVVAGLVQ